MTTPNDSEQTKQETVSYTRPPLLMRLRWWFQRRVDNWKNHRSLIMATRKIRHASEKDLRDMEAPHPSTEADLLRVVRALVKRDHDYGTCVYAMSLASVATFNYVAHKLGVTGFQASCADLDIIGRTRHMKQGFAIVDYNKLLYPQFRDQFDKCSWDALIEENKDSLRKAANVLLIEHHAAHPAIKAHWERLASA